MTRAGIVVTTLSLLLLAAPAQAQDWPPANEPPPERAPGYSEPAPVEAAPDASSDPGPRGAFPRRHLMIGGSMDFSFWHDLHDFGEGSAEAQAGRLEEWEDPGFTFGGWIELSLLWWDPVVVSVIVPIELHSFYNDARFPTGKFEGGYLEPASAVKAEYVAEVFQVGGGLQVAVSLTESRWARVGLQTELLFNGGLEYNRLKIGLSEPGGHGTHSMDWPSARDEALGGWVGVGLQETFYFAFGRLDQAPPDDPPWSIGVGTRLDFSAHFVHFSGLQPFDDQDLDGPIYALRFSLFVSI